jgi:hypothetical protein
MDWWLPAISAGAGLAGVLIGSWLTTRREREERRLRFTQQQLEEFYAPFCALREEIRAKGEVRVRVSKASAAEWAALFEGIESPELKQEIEARHKDQFEQIVPYNNKQLADEHIPGYRRMLDLFREKLWLVERSTRIHYPTLVEFVEVWNRRVAGSLPASVAERMGRGEENLESLYEDTERHRDQLQRILKAGGSIRASAHKGPVRKPVRNETKT